jgi:predicted DNA-binding transcriptional regulator AlpA
MKTEQIENTPNPKRIIRGINALAKYLGLSKSWAAKAVMNNEIPCSKLNPKLVFFDCDELDAYVMSKRIQTKDDVEKKATNYLLGKREISDKNSY